jgi:signal transduction histidine kinase
MDMSWILKKISSNDEALQQKIKGSIELLNGTIKTVRKIATELRPSILDDLGLIEAIQWQSREFEKRSGIQIQFNCSVTNITLEKNIAVGLFRIYQESLTNVSRHAEATNVSTTLQRIDTLLVLNITDNGKGFDVTKIHHKKTMGLLGMKERTLMMGGKCILMSEIGKGTSVLVSVPVQ